MAAATATRAKAQIPETQKWDKDKIADKFQKFHRKHKRAPKGAEAEARFEGLPSKSVVISHFGKWNDAIAYAGLPVTVAPQLRGGSKKAVAKRSRPKAAPRKRAARKATTPTPEALASIPVATEQPVLFDKDTVETHLTLKIAANHREITRLSAEIQNLTAQNAQIEALAATL